jgi:glycosyltransferase involved in cell wall biosynthesis
MAYGLPTIVNAHPALSDLPSNSVLNLSESCDKGVLIGALEKLYGEPGYRAELGQRAQEYIRVKRSPALIARQFAEAVEEFADNHPVAITNRVVVNVAELAAEARAPDDESAMVACCIAENRRTTGVHQLLVDVTVLVSVGDARTGIQRVARAILAQLLASPPPGYRVEPVFRAYQRTYRYARRFVRDCLHLEGLNLEDAPVSVNPGDVFLGLDFDAGIGADDRATKWLLHHRQRGMKTFFIVHDLLPVLRPDCFEPQMQGIFEAWLSAICTIASGLVCVSRAVANELSAWLDTHLPPSARRLDIGFFHHGSDIEATWPNSGLTSEYQIVLNALRGREVLAMIGTIEPRKGHSQALSAMEHLWAAGENLSLVICGKQGWIVESIAERLRCHRELGHRLFWMDQATDEALLQLYSISSGMLMASEGEGFGLPLVEAARHAVPIIARDLPVFREVAGEHAFYFSGTHSTDLADALQHWLKLYRLGHHPKSSMMPRLTWQQSTQQLLQVVLEGRLYKRWQPPHTSSFEASDASTRVTADGRTCGSTAESPRPAARFAYVSESSN